MGSRSFINKLIRGILLTVLAAGMLIYLAGVVCNVFGLLDFIWPEERILDNLSSSGRGQTAVIDLEGSQTYTAFVQQDHRELSTAVWFVHGSPGSLEASLDYVRDEHLQAHAMAITYDRLGFGRTTPGDAEGSLAAQARQLSELIGHFNASGNIVVGHSLGCTIAAWLAMDQPELIDGLVLVAAPMDPGLEPSSWWRPLLDFPIIRFAMPKSFRASNEELTPLKDQLEAYVSQWNQIRCPVTVIHGEKDRLVPVGNVDFMRNAMSGSEKMKEVILKEQGHFIYWTEQDLITDEIIELIDSLGK